MTIHLFRDADLRGRVVRLAPGELLCGEGEATDSAFLLLRGGILAERAGRAPMRVAREGDLLGETAALTGRSRFSLYADGPGVGVRARRGVLRAPGGGASRALAAPAAGDGGARGVGGGSSAYGSLMDDPILATVWPE